MGSRRKTSKADYGTKAQQMANANPTTCALPNYGDGFPMVKARCKQIGKHSTGQYNMPYTDSITGKTYPNAQDANNNINPALMAQIQTDEANYQQANFNPNPTSYQPAYQPNVSQYQPQYQPAYVNPQSQYYQQQYQPQYVDPNAGVGYIDPNGPGYGNQSIPDPNADPMAADSLQSESLANQEAESSTGETLAQQQADFYNSADGETQIMGVTLTPVKVIGGVLVLGLVGVAAFYGYKKFKKGK